MFEFYNHENTYKIDEKGFYFNLSLQTKCILKRKLLKNNNRITTKQSTKNKIYLIYHRQRLIIHELGAVVNLNNYNI